MIVYEWVVSLEDEIALIWCGSGRLTVVSTVYILSRYGWILHFGLLLSTLNPISNTVSVYSDLSLTAPRPELCDGQR